MPTQITQIDDAIRNRTILRVSGSLTQEDAELIEKICAEIAAGSDSEIVLDLAELDFLDSDSASVLSRLKQSHDVELEGVHLMIQNAIDVAERGGA